SGRQPSHARRARIGESAFHEHSESPLRIYDLTLRYRSVLTYFRPESIISVTTLAPGPSFFVTRIAACTFPPEDVPAKIPSCRANCGAISLASAVFTDLISSTAFASHSGGVYPMPIPSMS